MLQRFRMRLQRKFPLCSAMWRQELQKRGAIHFHLIVFNMPYWAQRAIQEAWEGCTGEETSIVHVKLLRNARQAMYYVSKYIAKCANEEGSPSLDNVPYLNDKEENSVGRQWGYFRAALLPYAALHRAVLLETDVARYLRFAIKAMSRFRSAKGGDTLTLYSEESYTMLKTAVDMGGVFIENNDFDDYAIYITGNLPYSFLRESYRSARPFIDWKKATDLAYKRLEQEFLTKQRLTASMSWIDRRR